MKPDVSVIVLADYAAGAASTYEGLRTALHELARQSFKGTVEHLVIESARFRDRVPADLTSRLPELRIVFSEVEGSFGLRNVGVAHAAADIIVFLDADCVPDCDWLHYLVSTIRSREDIAVVSGRTVYGGQGVIERTLSLLSRAYVEHGRSGEIRHISNNNAGYRKRVLLAHPFPTSTNPFVTGLHAGAIMADGGRLWFEPRARVVHAYGGWRPECDVSRNAGWATIAVRQTGSQARLAWLVRLGHASIPVFVLVTLMRSWWRLVRYRRFYGLSWYEIPLGLAVAAAMSAMQAPGMRQALRGRTVLDTPYR